MKFEVEDRKFDTVGGCLEACKSVIRAQFLRDGHLLPVAFLIEREAKGSSRLVVRRVYLHKACCLAHAMVNLCQILDYRKPAAVAVFGEAVVAAAGANVATARLVLEMGLVSPESLMASGQGERAVMGTISVQPNVPGEGIVARISSDGIADFVPEVEGEVLAVLGASFSAPPGDHPQSIPANWSGLTGSA